MENVKLKIEYVPIEKLEKYSKNARKHGNEDVSKIKQSIQRYGFNDPIGVWSDHNVIVEGHGRLAAAKALGLTEVPVIRLDHMTDEERRQYAIAHNRTAELSTWDLGALDSELAELDFSGFDLSFSDVFDAKKIGEDIKVSPSETDAYVDGFFDKLAKEREEQAGNQQATQTTSSGEGSYQYESDNRYDDEDDSFDSARNNEGYVIIRVKEEDVAAAFEALRAAGVGYEVI